MKKIMYVILGDDNTALPLKDISKTVKVSKLEDVANIDFEDYTHAIILPTESEISDNYLDIVDVYYEQNAIMLPLVVMQTEKISGVLNTCIWNPNLTGQIGELDHELAIKQIDLTMFGALIPVAYLITENFNADIKFYQHFYFFNKVTYKDIKIIGVPKTIAAIQKDLSYSLISNEEKTKYFEMAKNIYPTPVLESKLKAV